MAMSTAEELVSCYNWWRGYTRFSAVAQPWPSHGRVLKSTTRPRCLAGTRTGGSSTGPTCSKAGGGQTGSSSAEAGTGY